MSESLPSKEKPPVLYHGSANGDIEIFTPRVSGGTGEAAGPQIYASQDRVIGIIFTANVDGSWSVCTIEGVPHVIIPMTQEDFVARDTGGYLYMLPADSFESDCKTGLGPKEWASPVPVVPSGKIRIESSLNEMEKEGVQVHFVDKERYLALIKEGKRGPEILRELGELE